MTLGRMKLFAYAQDGSCLHSSGRSASNVRDGRAPVIQHYHRARRGIHMASSRGGADVLYTIQTHCQIFFSVPIIQSTMRRSAVPDDLPAKTNEESTQPTNFSPEGKCEFLKEWNTTSL